MSQYDTFWSRVFAGFIDFLILSPVYFLEEVFMFESNPFVVSTGLVVCYSCYYIYSILLHWRTGRTLGKEVMKIRVVDLSETKLLSFKQSFFRDCVYFTIEMSGVFFLINYIISEGPLSQTVIDIQDYLSLIFLIWFVLEVTTTLTNKKRRSLHDFIAGSVVVREEYWKGLSSTLIKESQI